MAWVALLVAAAACAAYGFVVLGVGSGTGFFAFWFALAALLLAAAWAVRAGWIAGLPQAAKRTLAAVAAVALVGFAVTQACIARDFGDRGEPDLDYLVVLGAQVRTDGPSVVLAHRLDAACAYLGENERTRVIVTGGQGANEPQPEGDAEAAYLVAHGIAPERIMVERASTSTRGNLQGALAFVDPQRDRIGIVTNNFHVFRGVHLARGLGMAHVCGLAADSTPLYLPNNLVRESLGIAKDALAGHLR